MIYRRTKKRWTISVNKDADLEIHKEHKDSGNKVELKMVLSFKGVSRDGERGQVSLTRSAKHFHAIRTFFCPLCLSFRHHVFREEPITGTWKFVISLA